MICPVFRPPSVHARVSLRTLEKGHGRRVPFCYHFNHPQDMAFSPMFATRIACRASLLIAAAALAQGPSIPTAREISELVRTSVDNEIKASQDETAHFMFRSTKTTPRGSVTKVYIEAKEATAGMVVAYDGKPLTPEQRKAEEARIDRFIKNPDELRKKHKQEQEDANRSLRIVRAIPDAFLFEYAGEEKGTPGIGKPGASLMALNFRPNPDYDPPSRVEQALAGMEGTVLIDPVRRRLASIDGRLFKEVGFGWGILGHLDKGGHFLIHQQDVRDPYWYISRMSLKFTGKILLVKNLSIESEEIFTEVKLVPEMTFADAVEMLKKEEPVVATKH